MIIYLCIKFDSITLIVSKDIERKPFFKAENFSKLKKGHNSQNNWWILPKIKLDLYFIHVYKISIQYTNLFKRYRTDTICVTYRTDGRDGRTDGRTDGTDSGDTICPHTPPLKMAGA